MKKIISYYNFQIAKVKGAVFKSDAIMITPKVLSILVKNGGRVYEIIKAILIAYI